MVKVLGVGNFLICTPVYNIARAGVELCLSTGITRYPVHEYKKKNIAQTMDLIALCRV